MDGPKSFQGIMLSSTFTDLREHRAEAISAIREYDHHACVMESDTAATVDVIDSSLQKVRDAAAYILIIGRKYGQIPECSERNRDGHSITELEFDEAVRRSNLPMLLFIMDDEHPVRVEDVEPDSDKRKKLDSFRDRAKLMRSDGKVERIYGMFKDLQDFSKQVRVAIGKLRLDSVNALTDNSPAQSPGPPPKTDNIPIAVPRHFLGRDAKINAIATSLRRKQGRAVITALHGMRGVGKTTLAAAYAERHRGEYRAIWWINADNVPAMRGDLVSLGRQQGWVKEGDEEANAFARVKVCLSEDVSEPPKQLLLIYDNAHGPNDIKPFLPTGGSARMIITSNATDWSKDTFESIDIETWPSKTGAEYLKRMTNSKDTDAALALSNDLEGLPLAHEQAAAYCCKTGASLAEFRLKFDATPDIMDDPEYSAPQYQGRKTVGKTFQLALEQLNPAAAQMICYAALLAPEPVPLFLFSDARAQFDEPLRSALAAGTDKLVADLLSLSLVKRESTRDERDAKMTTSSIRLHRLVRSVARRWMDRDEPQWTLTSARALGQLVAALDQVFPKDNNAKIWRLFPHVVEVLMRLSKQQGERGQENRFSRLARLVVMALHVTQDERRAGKIIPDYLANVLGDFYEVEPLKGPLRALLKEHTAAWPKLEKQFLSTNNYVLRYAVGEALAFGYGEKPKLVQLGDLTAKLDTDRSINEFEAGGYALNLLYARDPDLIAPAMIRRLADRPEYTGRSILADLFLSLAFDEQSEKYLQPYAGIDRFWNPIWDLIELDVSMIEAAQLFRGKPQVGGSMDRPEDAARRARVGRDVDALRAIEKDLKKFLAIPRGAKLEDILSPAASGYWSLGKDTDRISHDKVMLELGQLGCKDLQEVIRLLFSHPVWVVAESACTVLISLIARKKHELMTKYADVHPTNGEVSSDEQLSEGILPELKRWIDIVEHLFDDRDWRVQYGACEAAYVMALEKELTKPGMALFMKAIKKFSASDNPKIRGNLAENLFSFINSRSEERLALMEELEQPIRRWFRDDDCWVLEHVFCLFQTLKGKLVKEDFDRLRGWVESPLLVDTPDWHHFGRGEFLQHIEERKQDMADRERPPPSHSPPPMGGVTEQRERRDGFEL